MTESSATRFDRIAGCLAVGYLVILAMVVSPLGSFPAGYDAFWNLFIARQWADGGLPAAVPAAGFTQLAEAYGDRQLLFHGLLRTIDSVLGWGDARLEPQAVAPVLWGLVAAQGIVLWWCMRAWRQGSALWLFALPAVSQTWLFRTALLRDMLLGVLFLLPLVALAARRASAEAPPSRAGGLLLGALAAGYGYSHGAPVLPLVLFALVAVGGRLDRRRWPWADGAWIVSGIALACIARPDFPAILTIIQTLNIEMPIAHLRGEVGFRPAEFTPLRWGDWTSVEWPYFFALAALLWVRWRRLAPWSLWLPVAFCALTTILSSRMFELASPMLVLLFGCTWGWRGRTLRERRNGLGVAVAAILVAIALHAPRATRDARNSRFEGLLGCGDWIAQRAAPQDTVFVADWGASSPLAWFSRETPVRFTGVIDPILMWRHDRDAWEDWRTIKEQRAADPIALIRQRFGARFVVCQFADPAAGYLYQAMRGHRPAPPFFVSPQPANLVADQNWWVYDLGPQ